MTHTCCARRGLTWQVEATKKQEEAWQALIPHIEAMELEGDGEGDGMGMGGPDGMVGM